MQRLFAPVAVALAAAIPLAALAQETPQPGPAGPGGPRNGMRAQFEKAHDAARTAALNDLSPDHRARVQGIVDQVNSGTLTDLRAAAQQIDAILTPEESRAVLGERDKMISSLRAQMPAPPPGPAGPGAGMGHAPGAMNDAGIFLLAVSISRERMRALHGGMMRGAPMVTPSP